MALKAAYLSTATSARQIRRRDRQGWIGSQVPRDCLQRCDYDNDGYADLALSFIGRVLLLHNEKNGTFKDASAHLPVKANGSLRIGTWIDYDHDGDIDLFLGSSAKGNYKGSSVSDELWRNNGDGTSQT